MAAISSLGRITLVLALALPLACVNPFKPADPEPPSTTGLVEDFSRPDSVLETMRRAIESKSPLGSTVWLRACAESTAVGDREFVCFYDQQVRNDWLGNHKDAPPPPDPWKRANERGTLGDVFGFSPGTYQLQWDPDLANNDDIGADTVQFHRKYTLTTKRQNQTEIIAIGFCDLSFQFVNGAWRITRWKDRLDPSVGVSPPNNERTMSWWRLESLVRIR